MENQNLLMNPNYRNQAIKEFNGNNFPDIPNHREAFIKFTLEKLKHWIIIEYFDYFEGEYIPNVLNSVDSFIKRGTSIRSNKEYVPVTIGNFESDLSDEMKYLTITKDSPPHLKGKMEAYKKFLIEVERNFTQVDALNFDCQIEGFESTVFEQLINKMTKKVLDINLIYDDIYHALNTADKSYRIALLSFDKNYYFKNYKNNESNFFILPKYANPIELKEFPKERLQFHKAIKTMINKLLDIRKSALNWEETPEEYKCIEEFAQELTPNWAVESQPKEIPEPIYNTKQNQEDYPKHIFLNPKAFLLFEELNERLESIAQVSFLYRMMAEKDNLIVVKDTPFRSWYNNNNYKLKLLNTTKTLEQATNKDRELWYNKVKELIYNR